jgi:predicted PurR-regulated permease PerM
MGILNLLFSNRKAERDALPADQLPAPGSWPFFIKAPLILLGLSLLVFIMIVLRDVLVPVGFATLIAILLNPVVNRLMKWRIPKPVSILLAVLMAAVLFAAVMFFIVSQLSQFSEFLPQLKQTSTQMLEKLQTWVESTFNYPKAKQAAALQKAQGDVQPMLTGMVVSIFGALGVFVLLPIYTFLILYYKPLFLNFFYDVFEDKYGGKVAEILGETKIAIQKYVSGLLIETVVVAVLNTSALLLLGVRYALLLGVIGALLNLIPYIGGLVAISLPVIISLVDNPGDLTIPVLTAGSYLLIQFIDNNLLVPRIVSSKVDVNAFMSIIVILMGGAMWGVAGMFLSIPFIAICKIVFDRIDGLKPWGKILGVKMEGYPPSNVVNETDANAVNKEEKAEEDDQAVKN